MIGLDTNVLVRYLMRDDEGQTRLADSVIDALGPGEGFVPLLVLAELHWTLVRAYGLQRQQSAAAVTALVAAAEIDVESPELVHAALRLAAARGADFADAVIAGSAAAAGCSAIVTFDRGAARSAGMTLLH